MIALPITPRIRLSVTLIATAASIWPLVGTADEARTAVDAVVVAKADSAGAAGDATVELKQVDVIARAPAKYPTPVEVLDADTIAERPVTDALDLFRQTPGAITVNFGQGDIGNPIGLRGFVSDHGQDVAIFIDGVPINVANHAHAHGLADIGWLQPEFIERVEVIKGPFSAQYGNFALGGVINIVTKNASESLIDLRGGSYGSSRALGVYSQPVAGVTPFLAYEVSHRDGYRDSSSYNRYNLFNKASLPLFGGTLSVRAQAVARDFEAPGYVPLLDVRSGDLSPKTAINQSDGGNSQLYDLVVNFVPGAAGGPRLSFYGGHDQLNRYADFVRPDQAARQRQDHSERDFVGWRGSYDLQFANIVSLTVGTDGQYDDGSYQRYPTVNRVRANATRDRDVTQLGTAVWAQASVQAGRYVSLIGGLRYDRFDIDIDNRITPGNSGSAQPDVVSPKIGAVVTPFRWLELFANTGRGFRSPSASELSPDGAGTNTAFGLNPPTLRTTDTGVKLRPAKGLTLSFDYYFTKTRGEINQQLDPVTGEIDFINIGTTTRNGYEAALNYSVSADLDLFAGFSGVNARLDGAPRGADYVANVPYDSQTFGATWRGLVAPGLKLVLDGYVQRLGEQPLAADRSTVAPAVTRLAAKASLLSRGPWSGFVQLVYLPDGNASESIFDFGDPRAPATTDIRYSPNPTVDALVGLKYNFR